VIIYNDAEKISKDLFILIRLLNNIHDHSSTLVSQVIVGTSKLDELFDDPVLRSLTQYLNQSFTLPPMSRIDLDDFYTS
jgi:type II secretory pathway predicted ATPase ExeA